MALRSLNYITKETYIKDSFLSDYKVLEEHKDNADINNYFQIKTQYFSELMNLKGKSKNITSKINISGKVINTTYPLVFLETDGEYIIHVVNDVTPHNVIYEAKISCNKSINVSEKLSDITDVIKKNKFIITKWDLFNKIERLRKDKLETEALFENNMINPDDKNEKNHQQDKEIVELQEQYRKLKSRNSSLNIEYNILNNLVHNFISSKLDKISSYSLDLINENKTLKDVFNNILKDINSNSEETIKKLLINYHLKYKIINQTGDNLSSDIVFYKEEEAMEFNKIGILHNGFLKDENVRIRLMNIDGNVIEVDSKNTKKIIGLESLLKNTIPDLENFTISYEDYRQIVMDTYPEGTDKLPEYSINTKIDSAFEGNFIKPKVNYFYDMPEQGKISSKKLSKNKSKKKTIPLDSIKLDINIVPEHLLFEKEDMFMYYFNSRDANPGEGISEKKIGSTNYDKLNAIKDWRKKLSNFYISRDAKGNIIPIIIDGMPFATVEHFFHFSKFWNNPRFQGAKKSQYNNHAMKFRLDYKGTDGWGRTDGAIVKNKGGKLSGFEHREDWLKPIKGITKESIESQQVQGGGGNFITLRDFILTKGNFAKFSQINEMREVLLATEMAKLIHPEGGSVRTGKYKLVFDLMYVRYLIKNGKQLINYKNADYDKNMTKLLLKKHISEILKDKLITHPEKKNNKTKDIYKDLDKLVGFEMGFLKKEAKEEIEKVVEVFRKNPSLAATQLQTVMDQNDDQLDSIEAPYFKTNIMLDTTQLAQITPYSSEPEEYLPLPNYDYPRQSAPSSVEVLPKSPVNRNLFRRFKQSIERGEQDNEIYEQIIESRPRDINPVKFLKAMENVKKGNIDDLLFNDLMEFEEDSGISKEDDDSTSIYLEKHQLHGDRNLFRRFKQSVESGTPDDELYEKIIDSRFRDINDNIFLKTMSDAKEGSFEKPLFKKLLQFEEDDGFSDKPILKEKLQLFRRFKQSVEQGLPDESLYRRAIINRPKDIPEEQFLESMRRVKDGNLDDAILEDLITREDSGEISYYDSPTLGDVDDSPIKERKLFRRFKQSVEKGQLDEDLYKDIIKSRPEIISEESFKEVMEHARKGQFDQPIYEDLIHHEEDTSFEDEEVKSFEEDEEVKSFEEDEEVKSFEEDEEDDIEYKAKYEQDYDEESITPIPDDSQFQEKKMPLESYQKSDRQLIKRYMQSIEKGSPDKKLYTKIIESRPKDIDESELKNALDKAADKEFDNIILDQLIQREKRGELPYFEEQDEYIGLESEQASLDEKEIIIDKSKKQISKIGTESLDSIDVEKVKELSIESNQELLKDISGLNRYISKLGKVQFEVPPNGDCGYHSIIEMMAIQDIHPLNFSTDEPNQYNSNKENMQVVLLGEKKKKPIYYNAMLELRRDVASKFKTNFSYDTVQSLEIENIKVAIASEIGEEKFTQEVYDNYVIGIENSAQEKSNKGAWISDTELGLISAMFNINITVYNSVGNTTNYIADNYKRLYSKPPSRNITNKPATIELGYISNAHYVGILDNFESESELEKITYHAVTLETTVDSIINLAFDLNKITPDSPGGAEIQIKIVGIYEDDHTITHLDLLNKQYRKLIKSKWKDYLERNNINFETVQDEYLYTKLDYYKDTQGNIYKDPDKEIKLGELDNVIVKGKSRLMIKFVGKDYDILKK